MNFSYIFSPRDNPTQVTIVPMDGSGNVWNAHSSTTNFDSIRAALSNPETTSEEMEALISPAGAISKAVEDYRGIEVINGVLLYQGEKVGNSLATRILKIHSEGLPIKPWALFAEKLYRNPDTRVRDELDLFLEACDLPITTEGDFYAFKNVRADYTDIHSGKFDNSIGRTPSMPRDQVDGDRNRTCSQGLHFCSKGYLPSFSHAGSGGHTMIVQVSPEHVVAIPSDYNNAKGRASQYTVVGEIKPEEAQTKVWPAVSAEYGAKGKAAVLDTKTPEQVKQQEGLLKKAKANKAPTKTVSIMTKELGLLNERHMKNGIAKHGSMAAWAKSHGWASSTVRDWKKRLKALGADL